MASTENKIGQVRPDSRFESFEPGDPSHHEVMGILQDMARQIVANAGSIVSQKRPFANALLLFLHGKPGRGKTHLVEAFINHIIINAPSLVQRIHLARGRFTTDYICYDSPYGDAPIVVIDDMYQDVQNVSRLSDQNIEAFMKMIVDIYDNRRITIVTSNFPLLGAGLMLRVNQMDEIGRVVSRAKEVLSLAGEFELGGDDFRDVLASRRSSFRSKLKLTSE